MFYPEASAERCTAALLLDVDPVGLVRGRRGPAGEGGLLAQYANDRPYVASSFLSVAISDVFGTAMTGRSRERPELAATPIPLAARLAVVPCRGGEDLLRRLFEPLGYAVDVEAHPLDATGHEGVPAVVCEEKHMGSRAVAVVCLVPELVRDHPAELLDREQLEQRQPDPHHAAATDPP